MNTREFRNCEMFEDSEEQTDKIEIPVVPHRHYTSDISTREKAPVVSM